ncbi:MAG TPA: right-handed parallel beta-helix repeat-containing protein, partial [Geminicoccaceae bacterium]
AATGEIRLSPEQDVNAIIADAPAGARFVLADGLYRGFVARVNDDQAFVAEGQGAVLDGSVVLTDWERDGGFWVHDLPPAQPNPTAEGDPGSFALQREDLFADDRLLRPVGSTGELDGTTWHRSGDRAYVAFDPSARLMELGLLPHAFHGPGANVLIQGVTVRQYAPPGQFAAIEGVEGRGWRIVDVTAEHNHSRGLSLNHGMRVEGGHFNDNGQLGIGGPGDDVVIEGAELARNNYASHGRLWEAGGIKIVQSKGVVFRGNHVHHNDGTGVWFDWDNHEILIEDNLVELNQLMGIQYEASRDGLIRRNRVLRNDQSGYDEGWWGAEVLIQNSRNVEVIDNVIAVENNTGLMIIQQDRGGGDFGEHLAQGNLIEGNLFVHLTPGRQHGLFADHKPDEASGNVFARNRYIVPAADAGRPLWQLPGGPRALPEVQALGWEREGEVVPVAEPAAHLPAP